ncbi:metalloregulator ArsR/SmtB family transcription factor [Acerihabitans sp. TG2]|uniref:helix-turn-helix transcriptional regulator n=1 Tax=Acerihabitans sp. TG2 TaxID=3096008 RepID=UPI002B23C401|nr:metalloregulator ArsR/SmtB family transcription factor [Acerihabitans sp. TG2]MEA9393215.1 metalloregulator ArsR/SmtB family transcription factor [Acerihabitans sp. TG2]
MSSNHLEKLAAPKPAVHERLMTLLKTRGPLSAGDAGKILGTTGEAARQQFIKLASQGLVEPQTVSQGVGRPVQMWCLTAAGHAHFPDTHADLTVQLLRMIRNTFGESGIDKLIVQREEEIRQHYQQQMADAQQSMPHPLTLEDRLGVLVQIRTHEGYMAHWLNQPDGSYLLVENHCPICAAATTCQGFCRSELALFRVVLQAKVERSEHILLGSRRCAYRIWP